MELLCRTIIKMKTINVLTSSTLLIHSCPTIYTKNVRFLPTVAESTGKYRNARELKRFQRTDCGANTWNLSEASLTLAELFEFLIREIKFLAGFCLRSQRGDVLDDDEDRVAVRDVNAIRRDKLTTSLSTVLRPFSVDEIVAFSTENAGNDAVRERSRR